MTAYVSEIWRLRHFWLALVRVNLRRCYRHSILGLGWSLLLPLSMTVVLCTVFATLFDVEVRTFAPYLLAGLTVWNFLTSVMTQGCQSFLQGESYIRQHPAPLAIYPLHNLGCLYSPVVGAGRRIGVGVVPERICQRAGAFQLAADAGAVVPVCLVVGGLHGRAERAVSRYSAPDSSVAAGGILSDADHVSG